MNSKLNESDMEYLYKAILSLKDIDECKRFFTDLCTVPELKALSQRLQVAKMLNNENVYSEMVSTTGASTATISRVNRSLLMVFGLLVNVTHPFLL